MAAAPPLDPALRRRLGARIKAVREEVSRESLGTVALLADFDKSGLSRWERGETTPSLAKLIHLAEELGVLPLVLLAYQENEPLVQLIDAARRDDLPGITAALRGLGYPVPDGAIPPRPWKSPPEAPPAPSRQRAKTR